MFILITGVESKPDVSTAWKTARDGTMSCYHRKFLPVSERMANLAAIFKKVGHTNPAALCVMQFLALLSHQSFFGFEWIFGSFEAKVLCYVYVFYRFYLFL